MMGCTLADLCCLDKGTAMRGAGYLMQSEMRNLVVASPTYRIQTCCS